MSPLISIIIPVYNTEKYIRRCIDSVIAQSYSDWELILVDDGSTDGSGEICDEYAEKDERIRVFHKANGGVSSARNVGLDNANGEWVSFVDSDDWVENSYLSNYVDVISKDVQLVVQGIILDKNISVVVDLPKLSGIDRKNLVTLLENTNDVNNGYIVHKAFKTKIIDDRDIRFNEYICFAEDGLFFFNYLNYVEKINVTDRVAYHYDIREDTLTSAMRIQPLEKYETVICGIMDCALSWIGDKCDKLFYNQMLLLCWRLVNSWLMERSVSEKDRNSQLLVLKIIDQYKLSGITEISDRLLIELIKITSFRYPKVVYRYVGLRYKLNQLLK